MNRQTIASGSFAVIAMLALAACAQQGEPHNGMADNPPANTPAVAVQEAQRKCNDDPRPGEEDELPRCTARVASAPAPQAYRVAGGSGDPVDQVVCDIDDKFILDGKMFGVEFSGGLDGTYKFVRTPNIPGLSWKVGGRYHIEFPDGRDKPGTLDTEGGGTTTAGNQSRDTSGGEHFTLTPAEACKQ